MWCTHQPSDKDNHCVRTISCYSPFFAISKTSLLKLTHAVHTRALLSRQPLYMYHLSPFLPSGKPYIIAVYPHEGWTSGGTRVCIVGMNFYEGVEVVFGTLSASAEVRTLARCHAHAGTASCVQAL